MVLMPAACVISAMYCACMSVGKPGWGSVVTLEACSVRGARTRRLSGPSSMRTPVSRSLSMTARRCAGRQLRISTSPPAMAQAAMKVPVSMRSGITRVLGAAAARPRPRCGWWGRPRPGCARPCRTSRSARSSTSGSQGGVADDGLALGERRRHHHVLGAGDGDGVEVDLGAAQPLGARPRRSRARPRWWRPSSRGPAGAGRWAGRRWRSRRAARRARGPRGPAAGPAPAPRRAWS